VVKSSPSKSLRQLAEDLEEYNALRRFPIVKWFISISVNPYTEQSRSIGIILIRVISFN